MDIINLMEREVRRVVNQLCDELAQAGSGPGYCTSSQCRLDATCYVLNRIAPRYVTSSRGAAHAEHDYLRNPQLQIDILRLANEGLRRVTTIQRAYRNPKNIEEGHQSGPAFNFPTITGRLLNGETFAPVSGVEVELHQKHGLVRMIDPRWPNPYRIDPTSAGCFSFWPKPFAASDYQESRRFDFELSVRAEWLDPFHHYFSLELKAHASNNDSQQILQDYSLGELYVIPADSTQ